MLFSRLILEISLALHQPTFLIIRDCWTRKMLWDMKTISSPKKTDLGGCASLWKILLKCSIWPSIESPFFLGSIQVATSARCLNRFCRWKCLLVAFILPAIEWIPPPPPVRGEMCNGRQWNALLSFVPLLCYFKRFQWHPRSISLFRSIEHWWIDLKKKN